MIHELKQYIGLPWCAGATGPEAFDCWQFVRFIQKKYFFRDLPSIPFPNTLSQVAQLFVHHPERQQWTRTHIPHNGDCVLMKKHKYPTHVGLWIHDHILHCSQIAGVVYETVTQLESYAWQIEGIYHPFSL